MARRCLLFVLRWLERALFLAGVACASWVYVTWKEATFYQLYARTQFQQMVKETKGPAAPGLPRAPGSIHSIEPVIGLLDVPRLDLSVVVLEGDDDRILRIAVGHLPDTPLPWVDGNASMAGHRDTFFRALRNLVVGDDIQLATTRGTFDYRVRRMMIVAPDDVSVLHPDDNTALTLITCYPFTYLGDAPQRFVVQAERVARVAEEDPD